MPLKVRNISFLGSELSTPTTNGCAAQVTTLTPRLHKATKLQSILYGMLSKMALSCTLARSCSKR